jgi:hypothetical protein
MTGSRLAGHVLLEGRRMFSLRIHAPKNSSTRLRSRSSTMREQAADLAFTAQQQSLRDEVPTPLADKLPAALADKVNRGYRLS